MSNLALASYWHDLSSTNGGKEMVQVQLSTRTLADRILDLVTVGKFELHVYGEGSITSDLDIPDNITLVMHQGSKITISGTAVTLYIPNCICLGHEHFDIGNTCWLLFGRKFEASKRTVFLASDGGNGLGNVRFGLDLNVIPAPMNRFGATGSWTGISGNWSLSSGSLVGTGATTNVTWGAPGVDTSYVDQYWSLVHLSAYTSGSILFDIAGNDGISLGAAGAVETCHFSIDANNSILKPTTFTGTVAYVAIRRHVGFSGPIWAEWFGAKPGNLDCSPAINAAIKAAAYGYQAGREYTCPRIVRIGNGRFQCLTYIQMTPPACVYGSEATYLIIPPTTFVGKALTLRNESNQALFVFDIVTWDYSAGFFGPLTVLKDLHIDASRHNCTNFIGIYINCALGNKFFEGVMVEGPYDSTYAWAAKTYHTRYNPGIYDPARAAAGLTQAPAATIDICRWIDCSAKYCNNPLGAMYFPQYMDAQFVEFYNNRFWCDGPHLSFYGINSHIRHNAFNARPGETGNSKPQRVKTPEYETGGKFTLAHSSGGNTILSGKTTYGGYNDSIVAGNVILLSGLTGGWAPMNGMHLVTNVTGGNYTIVWNSSTYGGDFSGDIIITVAGGVTFLTNTANLTNIFQDNYFDGGSGSVSS